jgi:hypothetical protein
LAARAAFHILTKTGNLIRIKLKTPNTYPENLSLPFLFIVILCVQQRKSLLNLPLLFHITIAISHSNFKKVTTLHLKCLHNLSTRVLYSAKADY